MPDIWVSPSGSDTNSGLSAASPKATVQAGYAAVTGGATLHLLTGNYTDVVLTTTKSVNIVGEGLVRIIATPALAFTAIPSFLNPSATGNYTTALLNLRIEEYDHIIRDQPVISGIPLPVGNTLVAKHCTFVRAGVSSQAVFAWAMRDTGGGNILVSLENCTLRNWGTLFLAWALDANTTSSRFNRVALIKARSCFFDTYTKLAEASVSGDAGSQGTARIDFLSGSINANGYSALTAQGASFSQDGPGASLWGHEAIQVDTDPVLNVSSPGYTDTAANPPDLAINPLSGSPLLGTGYRGDSIGSGFWPTQAPSGEGLNGVAVAGTDWSGWVNDPLWYNTTTQSPGAEGPVNAQPAILSTFFADVNGSRFQNWVIGGAGTGSARVRSPVWDFGQICDFAQVSWESVGSGTDRLVSADQDYTSPTPGPQVEIRYSNTAFLPGDSSPLSWTKISKKQRPNISGRYWQARIVLRTDGF